MKRLLSLLLVLPLTSFAQVDIEAGKQKAVVCAACHQADGNSLNALWPKLAGQHAPYLEKQLQDFKKGTQRSDPSMTGMVAPLSQQDMKNLAAYYASQKVKLEVASSKHLKLGEKLYRAGDFSKKITACIACHGPQGTGNAQAGFPSLSGQHPQYIITQLQNFKSGKRTNDLNQIMQDIAKNLSEKDMTALANYISGLH